MTTPDDATTPDEANRDLERIRALLEQPGPSADRRSRHWLRELALLDALAGALARAAGDDQQLRDWRMQLSNATQRLADDRLERALFAIVALIVGAGAVFALGSGALFNATLVLPLPARVGIAVMAVLPLAFPMGMLFPIGVRLLARDDAELIPWAWATNGCFSVLGIFGTRITALVFGFSYALMLGLVAYVCVIGCVRLHARSASAPAPPC